MKVTPEIKNIYASIQKQLFYLIPEKWDRIYLYASVVEQMLNLANWRNVLLLLS